MLGGQVSAEVVSSSMTRGYVYLGGQLCAIQQNKVTWGASGAADKGTNPLSLDGGLPQLLQFLRNERSDLVSLFMTICERLVKSEIG